MCVCRLQFVPGSLEVPSHKSPITYIDDDPTLWHNKVGDSTKYGYGLRHTCNVSNMTLGILTLPTVRKLTMYNHSHGHLQMSVGGDNHVRYDRPMIYKKGFM